jgi:tetratricopeptide (TPR) repeat protein
LPIELKTLLESADQYIARQQYQAAEAIYARLSEACPDEAGIHHVHSLVLMELRHWEAASLKIEQSIRLEPENPSFYRTRGDILNHAGQPEAARNSYLQALDLMPTDVDTLINLGTLMHNLGALDPALQCYQKALAIAPTNIKVLNNIGKATHDLGATRQAVGWYDKALQIAPDYAEARFNRSVALLALGDYARGWAEYEWRFKRRTARRVYPHRLNSPRWDGSEYCGKRLLVHCEQGLGDVIQFCRYLPAVKRLGGTLLMDVHEPLLPLVKRMGVADEIYPFRATHPVPAGHDCHIPLMSLPNVF